MKLWQHRLRILALFVLLLWTVILNVYHLGVIVPPTGSGASSASVAWLDKQGHGLHHLILTGEAFGRGLKSGEITRDLMRNNEMAWIKRAEDWLPAPWMRQIAILWASIWYHGIQDFIDPQHLQELHGLSLSAPKEMANLADNFTRQVGLAGWQDLTQGLNDQGPWWRATLIGIPLGSSWIVGRNLDLERGEIFDTHKIVKWVFPEGRLPYVAVTWAGAVGVVTGVNSENLFVAINSAESQDKRRLGTPTSLLALKVLEEAKTAREAIRILQEHPTFISSIFTVADSRELYRVEKSPQRMSILQHKEPTAITNHFIAPDFKSDTLNNKHQQEFSTTARAARAQELAISMAHMGGPEKMANTVLDILRDKGLSEKGQALPIGNRSVIDALISIQSVIWDGSRQVLYIGKGPALTGEFYGYDLAKSFRLRRPERIETLSADKQVSPQDYIHLHQGESWAREAREFVRQGRCELAKTNLEKIRPRFVNSDFYLHALGDVQLCYGQRAAAKTFWQKALEAPAPYAQQRKELKFKIEQSGS